VPSSGRIDAEKIPGPRRLRRVRQGEPGFSRTRRGRGFVYVDLDGHRIDDSVTLERIRGLAIPPAWQDVWICADERGHLQVTGMDAAGRRQYLYHAEWRRRRDRDKFRRMERFAEALPDVRDRVAADLGLRGLPRARVLACAVRLLDVAALRIGSEHYTARHGSFGLSTLRRDHARVGSTSARFDFVGKSGVRHVVEVTDRSVLPVLRALRRRRGGGEELLAWRDGDVWRDVRAADINGYLKEIAGEEFSAKDFRTWRSTLLAAVLVDRHDAPNRRRVVTSVVKEVAAAIGNTPAVCRSSYIDPRVLDRYVDQGETIGLRDVEAGARDVEERLESTLLAFLRGEGTMTRAA
jgi:DNA topoisomerase-1